MKLVELLKIMDKEMVVSIVDIRVNGIVYNGYVRDIPWELVDRDIVVSEFTVGEIVKKCGIILSPVGDMVGLMIAVG